MEQISILSSQIDILKQRVRHGCKKDLLQLVNIRSIGRRRARELASMGYRTIKSLAAMSNTEKKTLSSKRGWGPKIVDNLLVEVEKIIRPKEYDKEALRLIKTGQSIDDEKLREDDIPLDDENYAVD
jgi:replicative superfamily II helicase